MFAELKEYYQSSLDISKGKLERADETQKAALEKFIKELEHRLEIINKGK